MDRKRSPSKPHPRTPQQKQTHFKNLRHLGHAEKLVLRRCFICFAYKKSSTQSVFSDQNDLPTWNHSPNGIFSTSSAYNISLELPNTPSPHPNASWKWLSKVRTIPRILSFLWLAYHECLPTKALLHERHILQDNLYPLGHASVESLLHILRDWSWISPIWNNLTLQNLPSDFFCSPTHAWMEKMTTTHQHPTLNNIPWTVIFPVAVWSIWSARNKFVMESASFDCHIIINKIQSIATDLLYCLPPHLTPSRRSSNLLVGNHCHQTTSN